MKGFDAWLTHDPRVDDIERGKLEDTLSEKIANMFDEVNVTLPDEVLETAVTYAANLAEQYVEEVTFTCDRCGAPIDEDNSAKDRQDPTIWVCAGGYGCDDQTREYDVEPEPVLLPVPDDYVRLLLMGVRVMLRKDDKRLDKGKSRFLTVEGRFIAEDILDVAQRGNVHLHYSPPR